MSRTPIAVSAGPDRPAGAAAQATVAAPVAVTVAGTEPYPWPWDGRFSPRRCALLIVGDGSPIGDSSVAGVVSELTAAAVEAGIMAVRVATGRPGPAGPAAVAGPVWPVGPSVTAAGWDGFYGSPLDSLLRAAGRDQLLLAGRLLETGVHSTLRSANDRGYECLTLGDACEAFSAQTRAGGMSTITMSGGIFGAIGSAADLLGLLRALAGLTCSTDSTDSTDSTEER